MRIVSGMRPTGALHLGHYHGVLKNWVKLQETHTCFFFVADWHALTTHYQTPEHIRAHTREMVTDWLVAGVDPQKAVLFRQSQVTAHAKLHLLLSMITPLSWLERMPTYKDQQQKLKDRDLSTYGFLGYPLLQTADIVLYHAEGVPVGEDQVVHIELSREIVRRFNHLYGSITEQEVALLLKKFPGEYAKQWLKWRKRYQESADLESLKRADAALETVKRFSRKDRELLRSFLHGQGKPLLTEPQPLLTEAAKMPGLDGQKMSKSYDNTIALREDPQVALDKIKKMPTDPARVRRHDPGDPERCPVWAWHQVYSTPETKDWVQHGCRNAEIGCTDCKKPLMQAIEQELLIFRERAQAWHAEDVETILRQGQRKAQGMAEATLRTVKRVMGL